jgi:hypothetical protein
MADGRGVFAITPLSSLSACFARKRHFPPRIALMRSRGERETESGHKASAPLPLQYKRRILAVGHAPPGREP